MRLWRNGNPSAPLVGMQTGAATVEKSMGFLKKLKRQLTFDPAVLLQGLHPKNLGKNLCTPMFIAAQFTIAKCRKQCKCPSVNEWIKIQWYIYTMEYHTAQKK